MPEIQGFKIGNTTYRFDSTPTEGHSGAVSSGGVKSYVDDGLATKQNNLTFDSTPTTGSTNPVTSGGVYSALATKQDTLTFDSTPTTGSTNPVTSGGVKSYVDDGLATKQNNLTFDSTPTTGSTNPVTSGGVKSYVDSLTSSQKGAANGLAELDANGKVPSSQLPSYVDDVLEYASTSNFPSTGETGKIYVAKDTNRTYRWGGSSYVEISASLALGETSSTAYAGDKGKEAYDLAAAALPMSGGTMTGNIAMGGNSITGLDSPDNSTDAATKGYVDTHYVAAGQRANTTLGDYATAEGSNTTASGDSSHAEGETTIASGEGAHAEGYQTTASGNDAHAEGNVTVAAGADSHAEGDSTHAGVLSSADRTWSSTKTYKHSDFVTYNGYTYRCIAAQATVGTFVNAEWTSYWGSHSHAEGHSTYALGEGAHAEGDSTTASGDYAHAEGQQAVASGDYAHAEGQQAVASGEGAHAEGWRATASGENAHAEGDSTAASGYAAHAEGSDTIANHAYQHVFGEYNTADPSAASANMRGTYVEIVGNGDAANSRSNARTLDWNGNEVLAGKLTVGDGPTNAMDVATKEYVDGVASSGAVTFDSTPTASSTNAVTSGGVYSSLATKQDTLTFDSTPTASSTNAVTSGGVYSALATKQDTLTFDSTPTASSTNAVTSGGVKEYVDGHYVTAGQQANATLGNRATAEGYDTTASGDYSHAEGVQVSSSGYASHAEGVQVSSSGYASHAEGYGTSANHRSQHVLGEYNIEDDSDSAAQFRGNYVEIVGNGASGRRSNARTLDWNGNEVLAGKLTVGDGPTNAMDVATKQYVDGHYVTAGRQANTTLGTNATAEGSNTTASGNSSHAEGNATTASKDYAHAEGYATFAGKDANAPAWESGTEYTTGDQVTYNNDIYMCLRTTTTAPSDTAYWTNDFGIGPHAEGYATHARGSYSHAEGGSTSANGLYSHAEGSSTHAFGNYAHTEGYNTTASGAMSHAEGNHTNAQGDYAHTEGWTSEASGESAHAEGNHTNASGRASHAEGMYTTASGYASHAEGFYAIANHAYQHVFGQYNASDPSTAEPTARGTYAEIVGNGTQEGRSNARTLDWDGNEVLAGKLTVGAGPTNNMDVATKQYVDSSDPGVIGDIKVSIGTLSEKWLSCTFTSRISEQDYPDLVSLLQVLNPPITTATQPTTSTYGSNSMMARGICLADNKVAFCCRGYDNSGEMHRPVVFSASYIAWTWDESRLTQTDNYDPEGICYNGEKWIVFGSEIDNGSYSPVIYVADAPTGVWTRYDVYAANESCRILAGAYKNNMLMLVGTNNGSIYCYVATGTNLTFTRYEIASATGTPKAVDYGNGYWAVLIGNNVWYTSNFSNWSSNTITSHNCKDICYGDGVWAVSGYQSSGGYGHVWYSSSINGAFSDAEIPLYTQSIDAIAYSNGAFVAMIVSTASVPGYVFSTDGCATFTRVTLKSSISSAQAFDLIADNTGVFYGCGMRAVWKIDQPHVGGLLPRITPDFGTAYIRALN